MQVITCHHALFGAAGPWRHLAGGKWGWKARRASPAPPVGRPAHRVARRCRGLDGAGERWYNKLF